MTLGMTRKLASLLLISVIGAPAIAYADDPVERAAERAADAKKDNKPKHDRPQEEPSQANRPDAGDTSVSKPEIEKTDKPVVEPKADHGNKLVPAQTGTVRLHRHHHHHAIDSDKRLHDPTDAGRR